MRTSPTTSRPGSTLLSEFASSAVSGLADPWCLSMFTSPPPCIGMIATLVGMYFIHRGHRRAEREKRMQYWREQNAFRQNILQMQETARHSIMTVPMNGSPRSTYYSHEGVNSEDSQLPMLAPQSKSSALRNQFSDDGFDASEESVMVQRVDRKDNKF